MERRRDYTEEGPTVTPWRRPRNQNDSDLLWEHVPLEDKFFLGGGDSKPSITQFHNCLKVY